MCLHVSMCSSGLVMIGPVYMAYPGDCQQECKLLPRLRPYPVRGHPLFVVSMYNLVVSVYNLVVSMYNLVVSMYILVVSMYNLVVSMYTVVCRWACMGLA